MELKVLDVAAGQATPFHAHPHAHEAVTMAGTGALRGNDGTQPLTPGDAFAMSPNEPHAIENYGAEPLRMLCLDCFIERQ